MKVKCDYCGSMVEDENSDSWDYGSTDEIRSGKST